MKSNLRPRIAPADVQGMPAFGGGPEWMRRPDLPCVQDDPDLWFSSELVDTNKAAARCEFLCPVRAECEQAAIERGEKNGVWGGVNMSWSANQKLRYQQRADVKRYRDEVVWLLARGRKPKTIATVTRTTDARMAVAK